jgi:hypothetical protein
MHKTIGGSGCGCRTIPPSEAARMIFHLFTTNYIEVFLKNPFKLITGLPLDWLIQSNYMTFKFEMHLYDSNGILKFEKPYHVTIFSKYVKGDRHELSLGSTAVDGIHALIPEIVKDIDKFITR